MWNIAGHTLNPGEKKKTYLTPNDLESCNIPATLVCGATPGKTLCVLAGVHSGEYPGIPASTQLAKELDPESMSGNVIFLHCVNQSGFWARMVSFVPEDGYNLNGGYPGDKNGTPGQQIAAYLVENIFPHVDFILDLHSGSKEEDLIPCLFFTEAAPLEAVREARAMAYHLNYHYLIGSQSTQSLTSYATGMGTPSLILERSCRGNCDPQDVSDFVMDMKMAMEHLEIAKWNQEFPFVNSIWCTHVTSLYSDIAGVWYPEVTAGQRVKKGQVLGHVTDIFGDEIAQYQAEIDGTIFYFVSDLPISKGEFLVYYGQ